MSQEFLNICRKPNPVMRDAYADDLDYIVLFGAGDEARFWYANGQTLVAPNSTVQQSQAINMNGLAKPNTFRKDCCHC